MPQTSFSSKILNIFLLFILLLAAAAPPVSAEDANRSEAQALALQEKYNALTSLSFTFDQVTRTGTRERTGHGDAVFYRFQPPAALDGKTKPPARQSVMRWNYTSPDVQVVISDGKTLSIYTEKDKQLIQTPAKELESDITYAFFAGTRKLLDDFAVEPAGSDAVFSSGQELNTLLLTPRKPQNQIKDIQIWFDDDYLIHHLMVTDHFDSVTELSFADFKINALLPGDRKTLNDIITFPLPPGTEIISR